MQSDLRVTVSKQTAGTTREKDVSADVKTRDETTAEDEFVREYELENDQGTLSLVQKQEGDVNCVVWDAALVLAKYLELRCLNNAKFLAGKRVIELGSGVGCVGLVAAYYGGRVTLTDLPEALPVLKSNVRKNENLLKGGNGRACVETLDWNGHIEMEPCDILLASDCIYYKESVSGFVNTLKALSTPATEIYLSQEKRSHSAIQMEVWQSFVDDVAEHFEMHVVPLRDQHEEYRSGDIYLIKMVRKDGVSNRSD